MAGINVGSVSVSVVPDASRFAPELDAKLKDVLHDVGVKITLDDMEAMGRLDELKARLDELGRKSESVKVNVDTSGASAELAKLKKEMDAATSGSGSAGAGGLSGLVKAAVALSPALLGVGQVATAVGVGVAGAFGAAIGGVGAFALAAKPVITSIDTAATAQEKYNNIVEQYGAKSTQAKAAANQLGLAMAQLTPAEQAAAKQMSGFKDAYQSWTQSFDPVVLPVFNNGLAIAKSAMKDLTPAIQGAGGALGGVTAQIRQSFASPAVAAQFKTFGAEVTQGIGSLGPVLANIVPAALNLFQAMNPLTTIIEDFLKSVGPQLPALAASLAGPFKTLAATFTQIGPQVGDLLSGLGHTIGGLLGALEPLVPVVLSVVDAFVKMVNNSGVLSFLKQVGGMIGGLLTALSPLIPVVGQLVGILADGLAGALGSIIQALDPVITLIAKSLAPILAPVAKLVAAVADALGHQLGAVITALTPILADLLPVVGRIASSLGTLLTGAIGQLLPVLGGALIDVLKAITPLLPPLANLLGTAITAAVTALAPVVTALAEALAQVLPSLLPLISNLVQGLLPVIKSITPILPELAQLIGSVLVAAVDLLVPVLKLVVEVMNAIPIPVLLPLLVSLVDPILGIVVVITELGSVWGAIWPVISSVLHAAWNDVIKPVFDALTTAGQAIADFFTKTVAPAFAQAWKDITGAFSSAWDWVSKTFSGLWGDIKSGVGAIVVKPVSDAVDAVTGFFGSKGPLQGAFNAVWDWVSGTFKDLWGDEKKGVGIISSGPLQAVVSVVSSIWGDIKKAFVTGVNDVIHLIDDFIDAIDKVTSAVGLGKLIPDIPLISTGSAATGAPTAIGGGMKRFAGGGVMPGYAPGQDSLLAMLSPGEAVLRPEVARWLGADTIHGWNRQAMNGGLPHFSSGGVWGDITGAASDVGGAIGGAAGAVGGAVSGALGDATSILRNLAASGAAAVLGPLHDAANMALKAIGGPVGQIGVGVSDKMYQAVLGLISGAQAKQAASGGFGTVADVTGAGPTAIWQALRSAGMTPAQAAGVMGNMQSESGFNPYIIQGGGTSMNPAAAGSGGYGLVQWTPGAKLIPYLGGQAPSIGSEVAALVAQLNGAGPSPEGAAGAALRAAASPGAAADVFGLMYERYAGPPQAARHAQAISIYDQLKGFDQGGWLQPGFTPVWNGTGTPEPVLNPQQWDAIKGGGGAQLEQKLDTLIDLFRSNPSDTGASVASEVDGVLQRAVVTHANQSLLNARTR